MTVDAHIALCVEGAYVAGGAVAVATLTRHFRRDVPLTVWVLHAGMPPPERRLYEAAMAPAAEGSLNFVRLPSEVLDLPARSDYITSATFGRLALARLLPSSVTRILYLDADTMIRGDLSELFSLDLAGAAAGAVREPSDPFFWSRNGLQHVFDLGLDPWLPYFNAGVLLLDAEAFRGVRAEERCLEYLASHLPERMDQDALNAVLRGAVLELPTRWNVENYYFKTPARRDRYRTILADARVLHYVGHRKPWNDPGVWLAGEWRRELRVLAGE